MYPRVVYFGEILTDTLRLNQKVISMLIPTDTNLMSSSDFSDIPCKTSPIASNTSSVSSNSPAPLSKISGKYLQALIKMHEVMLHGDFRKLLWPYSYPKSIN